MKWLASIGLSGTVLALFAAVTSIAIGWTYLSTEAQIEVAIRRAEAQQSRSPQLEQVYNSIVNAQSELEDASATLRQFVDRQSFDPERMETLNQQLEQFHC